MRLSFSYVFKSKLARYRYFIIFTSSIAIQYLEKQSANSFFDFNVSESQLFFANVLVTPGKT